MHLAVYCPFLGSALLGATAPALARRLPPATASRLLVLGSALAAASTAVALAVLTLTLVGELPGVAAIGHRSSAVLDASDPVPGAVAVLALVLVTVLAVRALRLVLLRGRALRAARALCRELGGSPGQLVVVDDDVEPLAVPTSGGRIVASRTALAALPVAERRALLLHEAAHLDHHHVVFRLVAELAGALDPLQARVAGAVVHATERWADEEAARGLGDRAVVARSLARSQLRAPAAAAAPRWAGVALRSGGSSVVGRVRALLEPAPRQRPAAVLLAALLVAGTVGTAVHASVDADSWFDSAAQVSSR